MDRQLPSGRPTLASWELLCGRPGDSRSVPTRLNDEVRRLAHAEWVRTGNPNQDHNWNEAQRQLGAKLLESGAVQWAATRALECGQIDHAHALVGRFRDATPTENTEAKEATLRTEVRELKNALKQRTVEQEAYVESLRLLQQDLQRAQPQLRRSKLLQNQVLDLEAEIKGYQADLSAARGQLVEHQARAVQLEANFEDHRCDLARGAAELAMQCQKLQEREQRANDSGLSALVSPRYLDWTAEGGFQSRMRWPKPIKQLDGRGACGEIKEAPTVERHQELRTLEAKLSEAKSALADMQSQPCNVEEVALTLCREEFLELNCQLAQSEATAQAMKMVVNARDNELRARDSLFKAQQARLHAQDVRLERMHQEEQAAERSKHREQLLEIQRLQGRENKDTLSAGCKEVAEVEERAKSECKIELLEEELASERERNYAQLHSIHNLEVRLTRCLERVHHASERVTHRAMERAGIMFKETANSIFSIKHLDYGLLVVQPALCAGFKLAMKEVLASEAGPGVSPSQVNLELSAGSVIVQASIKPPSGETACNLEARLQSSSTLALAVAGRVSSLEGIDTVQTGTISVEVHIPADVSLCPRQKTPAPSETVPHRAAGASALLVNHRGQVFESMDDRIQLFEISTPRRRRYQGWKAGQLTDPKPRSAVLRRVQELNSRPSSGRRSRRNASCGRSEAPVPLAEQAHQ